MTTAQAGIWGPMSETDDVLTEVAAERARQDTRWGEQNHPDGTGIHEATVCLGSIVRPGFTPAEGAKRANHDAVARCRLTWALILLEEVCEALEERDPARLREELLQVAAVAVNWVEAIDRRGAR